jgi:hypothetical protein
MALVFRPDAGLALSFLVRAGGCGNAKISSVIYRVALEPGA